MVTLKFRIYPTKPQQDKLWEHSLKCNWLYNYFLDKRIEKYKLDKTTISRYTQQNELPTLKQSDPILKEIHSQVLQQITLRLDTSYKNFFRRVKQGGPPGFPKFRSCRNFFTLTYPQSGFKLNDTFDTKAYGNIKCKFHREFDIKEVSRCSIINNGDKWYISILLDKDIQKSDSDQIIGLDVGIKNIYALSNGKIKENQDHSKYFGKIISNLQSKRDSKCKKGSRRYKYLSKVIKRLYGVRNRKVNDFLHKVSKDLSSKYDTIVIEDLKLKKMPEGKNHSLNRRLRESNIGKFIGFLKYKTNNIIEVNPYNTSKTCSSCGEIHEIDLSVRILSCDCGFISDRDVNAAINIFRLGQAKLIT